MNIDADQSQETIGHIRHLRGNAIVETNEMKLTADEIDYNDDTQQVEARGHVHYENFKTGEKVDCTQLSYNIDSETGRFENPVGSSPSQVTARPGLLTTSNPYYFQAKWAERLNDHYILHNGFLTDCLEPHPWWIFKGPVFDIVPGDHATVHRSWFYLKRIPLFYAPWFYKSLKKQPRRSGLLIPNFGNNSLHGTFVGMGAYWAIGRSFDLTYRAQYFTLAGLASHVELRGDINDRTGFDLMAFGIHDNQQTVPSQSGYRVDMQARSDLGNGWQARGELDYLSSFAFLQNFTQSFTEAVSSETHSVGFVTKQWSDYSLDFVAQRLVNFQSTTPGDTIEIRKLPEVDFITRDHELDLDNWPVWVSFNSSAGLLDRSQPLFETHMFVDRLDLEPQVSTALHWHNISLVPTFSVRETEYGASFVNAQYTGSSFLRSSRDINLDLIFPSLERVFKPPYWMGEKAKHVIEPRMTYKYVTGIDDFSRVIRFDENDLVTNTNQVEFSLTNRLLTKDKNGTVTDFLIWQVRYDRFFDPTFGGAVSALVPARNVIDASVDLTGYAFIAGPRHYSPVVSALRIQSKVNIEWRTDYDPLLHRISNSSVSLDGRIRQYFWSFGYTDVNPNPVLAAGANQAHATIGYGNPNRRGWNGGFTIYYDYNQHVLQFWQTQITKNTDCCGFSIQYRRFSIGTRDDSQIEGAFAISNIGTFGTLKKQERMF